jgi:aryl-alcohol dehydrogenase-like predicted oxidoreductase
MNDKMPSIPTRPLGKNGPLVPRIGYGTMGLSLSYGKTLPDAQRLTVLDHAYSIGATFWDTSDFYVRCLARLPFSLPSLLIF